MCASQSDASAMLALSDVGSLACGKSDAPASSSWLASRRAKPVVASAPARTSSNTTTTPRPQAPAGPRLLHYRPNPPVAGPPSAHTPSEPMIDGNHGIEDQTPITDAARRSHRPAGSDRGHRTSHPSTPSRSPRRKSQDDLSADARRDRGASQPGAGSTVAVPATGAENDESTPEGARVGGGAGCWMGLRSRVEDLPRTPNEVVASRWPDCKISQRSEGCPRPESIGRAPHGAALTPGALLPSSSVQPRRPGVPG
jgi:hypothetical protein